MGRKVLPLCTRGVLEFIECVECRFEVPDVGRMLEERCLSIV